MGEADMPQDMKPDASGRRKRSILARLVVAALSAGFMVALCFIGLFLFLSQGPISVPFIKDRVAEALEARIGAGVDVSVGEARLEKTPDGIDIHIYNVVFRDQAGKEILRSPEALVGIDPLRLATLNLVPRRLALQGMTVKAEVRANGDIRLSAPGSDNTAGEAARAEDVLGLVAVMARTGTISGLNDFSLKDARLLIDDQRVGREIVFDKVTAVFESATPGRAAIAGSARRGGDTAPFRIEAIASGANTTLNFDLSNVSLGMVATLAGNAALPFTSSSALSFRGALTVDGAGKPLTGRARINLSPGALHVPAAHPQPFNITDARLEANWQGAPDRIEQVSLHYAGDGHRGTLTGMLLLPGDDSPDYRFEGKTEDLVLAPLTPKDQPVTVTSGRMVATAPRNLAAFRIDSLDIDGPATSVRFKGGLEFEPEGVAATAEITAGRMPLRTALHWWPFPLAREGRQFMTENLIDGMMSRLTLRLNMPPAVLKAALDMKPLPAEALRLDVDFEDGSMVALPGLPPVTGLAGNGWVNALDAQVTASRGVVDLRGGGKRLQLSDGTIRIAGLDKWTPTFSVAFRSQAALEHMAEFINLPPLRDAFAIKVNPQDIRGQIDGRASISFLLGAPLKPGDIRTDITASLRNVTIEKAIGKDRLENATLAVTADATGVDVKGEGRWQGMPVTIALENDAQDKSSATVLSFTLDDAAQKRLGIGLAPQMTGPLPVKVRATREGDDGMRALVDVDLTRATIDGLLPGLQKPAGRSAKLSFEAIEQGKAYQLRNIAMDSGASSFRGQAEVTAEGVVSSARFNLFRLSPGDNVRLDFDKTSTGGKVTIRGNNFDARPFLRAASQDGPPAGKAERDLELELKTTLLSGNGGEVITNADLKLLRRNGQSRQIALSGRLNGKRLTIAGQSAEGVAPLEIATDDAGAFLRFLDIYPRMSGGDLVGQITPSGRQINGFFIARNFSLRNEPALRRLTSETTADGAQRATDTASFTKMRIDFNRTGSNTTIKDAVIFGPQLGLTFNGTVDTVRDRVSLSGTFIPAYGLNNAFAQIPVLGGILGGGRNEGLLAVTFGLSGRMSQPTVSVNPLSAVAPGIFRKFFEFRNDRTGSGPAPAFNPAPIIPN